FLLFVSYSFFFFASFSLSFAALRVLPSLPTRRSSDLGLTVIDPIGAVVLGTIVLGEAAAAPIWLIIVITITGLVACAGDQSGDRDRKSTRLNSSHVSISYAVFCLKKTTIAQCQTAGSP